MSRYAAMVSRLARAWVPITAAALTAMATAQGAAAAKSVALHFAWPSGLSSEVTFEVQRTKTINGQTETTVFDGRYRMTTSNAADGLLISHHDLRIDVRAAAIEPKVFAKWLLTAFLPSYVVSAGGDYVRIDNLAEHRSKVLGEISTNPHEVPAQLRDAMSVMLDVSTSVEGIMEKVVGVEWNTLVGAWAGVELDRGEVYKVSHTESIPILGGIEVPMVTSFLYKGLVPCRVPDTAPRCAELEMHFSIDKEALVGMIQEMMNRAGGGKPVVQDIGDFRRDTTIRVITEADTLLPHLVETTIRVQGTNTKPGEVKELSGTEVKRVRYQY